MSERGVIVNESNFSVFLMSFSLVYCSFCKSWEFKIARSPPQRHILQLPMPSGRHFNVTGSNTVKKCQRANGSQSLLQHTWLAFQLSEICLHWSWKKEIFIIWNKLQSPRAKSFKISIVLISLGERAEDKRRGSVPVIVAADPISGCLDYSPEQEHQCAGWESSGKWLQQKEFVKLFFEMRTQC